MRPRRILFATPFVIVASCKRPLPPPERVPTPDASADAAQPDAAIDTPADAAIDAAVIDATIAAVREPRPPPKGDCCANPPGPIRARVLMATQEGSDLVLTIGMPDGERWDPDRLAATSVNGGTYTPLPGGELVLFKCARRTCTGKSKLARDQVVQNPFVVLRRR